MDQDPLSNPPKGRKYTPESVGGLLKLFFRMLPNPAFPLKLYTTFIKVREVKEISWWRCSRVVWQWPSLTTSVASQPNH